MEKMTLQQILAIVAAILKAIEPYIPAPAQAAVATDELREPERLDLVVCSALGQEELNGEMADAFQALEAEYAGKIDPARWQKLLDLLKQILPLILPAIIG